MKAITIKEQCTTTGKRRRVTLKIHGSLTGEHSSQLFRNWVRRVLDSGGKSTDIIADMRDLLHLDKTGISALVGAHHAAHMQGSRMFLLGLSAEAQDLISRTLDKVFLIYNDEKTLRKVLGQKKH